MSVRLAPGGGVEVRRVKNGRPDVRYPLTVDLDDGDHVCLRGPFSRPTAYDLGYVLLEPSDTFIEHFWRSRWYTISEIVDVSGRRKGWYCDVARPARVSPTTVESSDLELDVWIPATGEATLVLDADDFAARALHRDDPVAHERALAALAELASLTRARLEALPTGAIAATRPG